MRLPEKLHAAPQLRTRVNAIVPSAVELPIAADELHCRERTVLFVLLECVDHSACSVEMLNAQDLLLVKQVLDILIPQLHCLVLFPVHSIRANQNKAQTKHKRTWVPA